MYKKIAKVCGVVLVFAVANLEHQCLQAQITHNNDVEIIGSLDVGFDATGVGFGFDTIRLSENNLRIFFNDTSNSASFPNNDWRIVVNASNNGGLNHFSIDDATGGETPFRIEAGADDNSIYIDSTSRVGIGRANPVVELHVTDGDSPTLRLEQDGSSGFTPQTWDVAGNETNFFIRDATNSSRLPFRITPGSFTNSLRIDTDGIGIGTGSPSELLHLIADGSPHEDAQILVQNVHGAVEIRQMLTLENNGGTRFRMDNTDTGDTWDFSNDPAGSFTISLAGTGGTEFNLRNTGRLTTGPGGFLALDSRANGDLIIAGTLTQSSDRNKKENFRPADCDEILEKVADLPINSWNFKSNDDSIRHMGPVAQDFHSAFNLGMNDTSIAPIDTIGVSLAAIQALNKQLKAKDAQIETLKSELNEMDQRMQRLESALLRKVP